MSKEKKCQKYTDSHCGYTSYKGFEISYSAFGGTTIVYQYGMSIKLFKALGEMKGKEEAKKYIDSL